ncbi:hypothetical protein F2Q70_00025921 [Brassica cretica]|uniref:DUF1985 domain-containing protein n=1 Tax=Brassica cretica TaxID=69181 RepID=A0A8S9LHY7_BRACR|nr:hypothetical protein F2Q70_00025921 [Brassica cretica]
MDENGSNPCPGAVWEPEESSLDPETRFGTLRPYGNPEVLEIEPGGSSLGPEIFAWNMEAIWEPGGSPLDFIHRTRDRMGNHGFPLKIAGLYMGPEFPWEPEIFVFAGTLLRLRRQDYYRKSLTGLEGSGMGVRTPVPSFAAFHVWISKDYEGFYLLSKIIFGTLRPYRNPEIAGLYLGPEFPWEPEIFVFAGTLLRLRRQDYYRKSLTGLEGSGMGVRTPVPSFAAFHVWISKDYEAADYSKLHKKWFVIARTPLRFSLQEYHAVTGLKISRETSSDVVTWKNDGFFLSNLLHTGGKITLQSIRKVHLQEVHTWTRLDRMRLIYLYVIVGVVMGRDEKVGIPHMYIKLVMDFDKLRKFHWGLVGVKNGYDEVNATDMYPNQPRTSSSMEIRPRTSQARTLRSDRARAKARSLCSDRARTRLGHYVATKHTHGSVAT